MTLLYTAEVTSTGGRSGSVQSKNGVLNLEGGLPKALGGSDDTLTNPEQLFAAGYASCFDSALNLVIAKEKEVTGITSVTAIIGIGQIGAGAFGLSAQLEVRIPGFS